MIGSSKLRRFSQRAGDMVEIR